MEFFAVSRISTLRILTKMIKLTTELFPLESLYDHISEFVRIDEHLRMKHLGLETVTPECAGWTFVAGQEVNEHKRIIRNIRCFLHYHAKEYFGEDAKMFSKNEYENVKNQKDSNYTIYENLPGYHSISDDEQFWFFMRALNDKETTMDFYKKLLEHIYQSSHGQFINGIEKSDIVKNLLSKCVFSLA